MLECIIGDLKPGPECRQRVEAYMITNMLRSISGISHHNSTSNMGP